MQTDEKQSSLELPTLSSDSTKTKKASMYSSLPPNDEDVNDDEETIDIIEEDDDDDDEDEPSDEECLTHPKRMKAGFPSANASEETRICGMQRVTVRVALLLIAAVIMLLGAGALFPRKSGGVGGVSRNPFWWFWPSKNNRNPTLEFRPYLQSENPNNNNPSNLETAASDDGTVWKFKILQLTDLHLGEAEGTLWGPNQDRKTYRALDSLISYEQPDLLVLSGDQLTANNCRSNATEYYRQLGEFLSDYGIPWAMIFGNHDDAEYEPPKGGGGGRSGGRVVGNPRDDASFSQVNKKSTAIRHYSREELLEVDQSFALSLSQAGPENVTGTSNYVLHVTNQGEPALDLFFLDSGGGSLPQAIDESQVEWLKEQAQSDKSANVPIAAFQHIPTLEHTYIPPSDTANSALACHGFQGEQGIAPLKYDAGVVPALADIERVSFLAVGHNHGNDYCCPYNHLMHVCFGRHSGYGGYGDWERGARVYEATMTVAASFSSMNWHSWVRLESGEMIDQMHL